MKLIITEENGKIGVQSKPQINTEQLFQLCFSSMLGAMRQILNTVPAEQKEDAKGQLYDLFNVAASRTLEQFAPELELRPNLTAQAILEAENRIIEEGRLGEVQEGS